MDVIRNGAKFVVSKFSLKEDVMKTRENLFSLRDYYGANDAEHLSQVSIWFLMMCGNSFVEERIVPIVFCVNRAWNL